MEQKSNSSFPWIDELLAFQTVPTYFTSCVHTNRRTRSLSTNCNVFRPALAFDYETSRFALFWQLLGHQPPWTSWTQHGFVACLAWWPSASFIVWVPKYCIPRPSESITEREDIRRNQKCHWHHRWSTRIQRANGSVVLSSMKLPRSAVFAWIKTRTPRFNGTFSFRLPRAFS